jgi:8-hydroxy-5-deazaflavin:NADPH oxidoreductase
MAAKLVCEAGYDPVLVGDLDRAKEFDGTPVYNTDISGPDLEPSGFLNRHGHIFS